MNKILLFDLDGTLLKSDKSISLPTIEVLEKCKDNGYVIGISTSRGELNCLSFLPKLSPDFLITCGGALIKKGQEYPYKALISRERTLEIIELARKICGQDTEITVDTLDSHYWNYTIDPKEFDRSWGDSIWTDYHDFHEEALKICVQIFDDEKARELKETLTDCDCQRFSDGYWYKFTPKGVTKQSSVQIICDLYGVTAKDVVAFGDDYSDIDMLKIAGVGVAMGNAIPEVKEAADIVIGTNDEDGIADYLKSIL